MVFSSNHLDHPPPDNNQLRLTVLIIEWLSMEETKKNSNVQAINSELSVKETIIEGKKINWSNIFFFFAHTSPTPSA